MTLPEMSSVFFRRWREELRQSYKPGSVRNYLAILGSVFAFAVDELEWLPESPLRKVRKPPEPPGRVRFLHADELLRLLNTHVRAWVMDTKWAR